MVFSYLQATKFIGGGKFSRYFIQSIKTMIQLSRYWNWAVILNAMKICVKASVGIYFRICGFVQLFLCFMWTGINSGSVKGHIIQGTFSLHVSFLHEVGSCVRTFLTTPWILNQVGTGALCWKLSEEFYLINFCHYKPYCTWNWNEVWKLKYHMEVFGKHKV